jgi:hypothetical protein
MGSTTTKTCPECGTPIPRRDGPGRPRIYCEDRCRWRAEQRSWRRSHPLGWRLMAEIGIGPESALDLLAEGNTATRPVTAQPQKARPAP